MTDSNTETNVDPSRLDIGSFFEPGVGPTTALDELSPQLRLVLLAGITQELISALGTSLPSLAYDLVSRVIDAAWAAIDAMPAASLQVELACGGWHSVSAGAELSDGVRILDQLIRSIEIDAAALAGGRSPRPHNTQPLTESELRSVIDMVAGHLSESGAVSALERLAKIESEVQRISTYGLDVDRVLFADATT